MDTHGDPNQPTDTRIDRPSVAFDEKRHMCVEGHSTNDFRVRTIANRARRALRWTGVSLLTEAGVILVIALVGFLVGLPPDHHLFWALAVGFCVATPLCILAAVVTAEVIEGQYRDVEYGDSQGLSPTSRQIVERRLLETTHSKEIEGKFAPLAKNAPAVPGGCDDQAHLRGIGSPSRTRKDERAARLLS